jgi:hypothetical protein
MPRIPLEPRDAEMPIAEAIQADLLKIIGVPQFFAGVGRKANVGNFETIDVYSAIAIPMGVTIGELNQESLELISARAAEIGFGIASAETFERYSLIKELQRGGGGGEEQAG